MAHIGVTWQCGHDEVIRAKSRYAEYWEHRAASEMCRDCWRDEQNRQASEVAKSQNLPALQGTPRQISWAETLRQTMIEHVAAIEAKIPLDDPNRPTWDQLVQKLRIQSQASWWIEKRGYTPLEIFRRWERERAEAEREKPVMELLGHAEVPKPSPQPLGFRPAARDEHKPPVAGYQPDGGRRIEL